MQVTAFSKLPGRTLDLSVLLATKKFRGRGNKDGALAAFRELEAAGLGNLKMTGSTRGASAVCAMYYISVNYYSTHNWSSTGVQF